MNSYIGKVFSNFRDFYNEINTATLTGAIDVVVVEQADGSYHCSPFHVRFGKLGVLRSREKVVDIEINGEPLDIQMKLGESGEAFFVEEVSSGELGDDEFIPPHLATSPIPSEAYLSRYHDDQPTGDWLGRKRSDDIQVQALAEMSRTKWTEGGAGVVVEAVDVSQEISLLVSAADAKDSDVEDRDHSSDTPKMFRAETMEGKVSEKVRRISIVTGEFRPISMELIPDPSPCKISELPADVDMDVEAAVEVAPATEGDGGQKSGSRKKRKKKALTKKKGANKKSSANGVGLADPAESAQAVAQVVVAGGAVVPAQAVEDAGGENIFQIDDLGDSFDQTDSAQQDPSDRSSEEKTPAPTGVLSARGPGAALSISLPPLSSLMAQSAAGDLADEVACMKHAATETNFHFFSDTEVTPGSSPLDSRPNSPIQSDTEAERMRHSEATGGGAKDEVTQSWRWGELPSPPPKMPGTTRQTSTASLAKDSVSTDDEVHNTQDAAEAAAAEAAAHRSIISGMFSFMKKTKRLRHDGDGIYLADINADELDPEVAALYFPASYRQMHPQQVEGPLHDEDNESGKGTSLPQSPLPQSPPSTDSEQHQQYKPLMDSLCMSLCGGLNDPAGVDPDQFNKKRVTFDAYCANVDILQDPDLVIKFEGKYYNYKTALPMVLSLLMYKRPLAQHLQDSLVAQHLGEDAPQVAPVEGGPAEAASKVEAAMPGVAMSSVAMPGVAMSGVAMQEAAVPDAELEAAGRGGYTSWFSWRKAAAEQPKKALGRQDEGAARDGEVEQLVAGIKDSKEVLIPNRMGLASQSSFQGTPKSEAIPVPTDKKEDGYNGSNSSEGSDSGMDKMASKMAYERRSYYDHSDKFRKTLRLSSEQIASLNLQEGANEVVFSVTTAYQGTTRCKCHIYKWRFDDRIVISDIDGTITKSDVLGHILPIVGKDWAQSGVAQLFTKIKNNGYKLLYLSARAIGQARVTREYLRSIRQGDLSLPDGPLLLNPTSLISAFHREVIEKKPEEFKISCLRDIHALFPADSKPFYAGYGNKVNDVWAYRAVGIPIFRIFTINHRGELKHELTQTFQSSYSNMSFIVDQMFPPSRAVVSEDYSSFVYWREPIADISLDPQILALKPANKVPNNKKSPAKKSP